MHHQIGMWREDNEKRLTNEVAATFVILVVIGLHFCICLPVGSTLVVSIASRCMLELIVPFVVLCDRLF